MYKLEEGKFWCAGINTIKYCLTDKNAGVGDVLATLEFDDVDIELTDRGIADGKRVFDYFCCKKLSSGEWNSWDIADFGVKKPYEFNSEEELKTDMYNQLISFIEKHSNK